MSKTIKKSILLLISVLFILLAAMPVFALEEMCKDASDAEVIMENAYNVIATHRGAADKVQPINGLYNNKWLISCVLADGIQNLDKAADFLNRSDVKANIMSYLKESSENSDSAAETKLENLSAAMKNLADKNLFSHSIFDRTRVIGLWLMLLCFLIHIACKLYSMFLGTGDSHVEIVDFALMFVRLITLMAMIMFLKPLAFYGMQISTVVSKMLLETPLATVISSGYGYTAATSVSGDISGASNLKGQSIYIPFIGGKATVTSDYAPRINPKTGRFEKWHEGLDIDMAEGTALKAPEDGLFKCGHVGGYANLCWYKPNNGTEWYFMGHIKKCGNEKTGEDGKTVTPVKANQIIARSGNEGMSTGPHLHLGCSMHGCNDKIDIHGTINPNDAWKMHTGQLASVSNPSTGQSIVRSVDKTTGDVSLVVSGDNTLTLDIMFNDLIRLRSAAILNESNSGLQAMITSGWQRIGSYIVAYIAKWLAAAVLSVLLILADVMMAITIVLGPIVAALSFIPLFDTYLQNWIKGYVTFLFYQPLASAFTILSFVMIAVTMDSGLAAFLILVVCYVGACMKIPNIADGLSSSALMSVAMMMAFAPAMIAMKTTSTLGGMAIGGIAGAMAGPGGATAGAIAGAKAGGAVGDAATDAAQGNVGGGGGSYGGGVQGQARPKKSSSGGHGGFVKSTALLAIMLCASVLVISGFSLNPARAATSISSATSASSSKALDPYDYLNEDGTAKTDAKKVIMNITTPVIYPSQSLVQKVLTEAVRKSTLSNIVKSDLGLADTGGGMKLLDKKYGISIINNNSNDGPMNGIYNTSYTTTVDMPITRFILGYGQIDATKIYELAFVSSYNKSLEDATAADLNDFEASTGAFSPNLADNIRSTAAGVATGALNVMGGISYLAAKIPVTSTLFKLLGDIDTFAARKVKDAVLNLGNSGAADAARAALVARGEMISAFLAEAQKAITTKLMFWVPLYILMLMFFIQIAVISYIKLTDPSTGEKASVYQLVPRLIFFMACIYLFSPAVGWIITFFNYLSNAIVPIETQSSLMANITAKTGSFIDNASFSGLFVMLLRCLTYMSVKILLIARDMFMAVTCMLGPTCIAIGFFTRYRDPDPIHKFLSGWLEGFVKVLMWGPIAAIMLYALGVLSVLTSFDMLSTLSVAITAFAFLYAAANIPKLADKMSTVAIAGLLTMMSPYLLSPIGMGMKGVGTLGRNLPGIFKKIGSGGLINIAALGGLLGGLGGFGGKIGDVVNNIGNGGGGDGQKRASSFAKDIADAAANTGKKPAATKNPIVSAMNAAAMNAAAGLKPKTADTNDNAIEPFTSSLLDFTGAAGTVFTANNINSALSKMSKGLKPAVLSKLISEHRLSDIMEGFGHSGGYAEATGLKSEDIILRTAMHNLLGVRLAMNKLASSKGMGIGTVDSAYNNIKEQLIMDNNSLMGFVENYANNKYVGKSRNEVMHIMQSLGAGAGLKMLDNAVWGNRTEPANTEIFNQQPADFNNVTGVDYKQNIGLKDDVMDIIPQNGRSWLTNNITPEVAAQIDGDIRRGTANAAEIFCSDPGQPEAAAIYQKYNIKAPETEVERMAFMTWGAGLMRNAADTSNDVSAAASISSDIHVLDDQMDMAANGNQCDINTARESIMHASNVYETTVRPSIQQFNNPGTVQQNNNPEIVQQYNNTETGEETAQNNSGYQQNADNNDSAATGNTNTNDFDAGIETFASETASNLNRSSNVKWSKLLDMSIMNDLERAVQSSDAVNTQNIPHVEIK